MIEPKRIWNKKYPYPKDCVYIGRPSKWGNPFIIGKDGNRYEVIEKFIKYLVSSELFNELDELKNKHLLCWCDPKPCHGHVLVNLSDMSSEERENFKRKYEN